MNKLEQDLRDLIAETNERVARDPLNAYEIREESLLRAHDLVDHSRQGGLRLVIRSPLPPPGVTGMRRAGVRR